MAVCPTLGQLFRHELHRFIPGDGLPFARAPFSNAAQRPTQAIRVVQQFQCGLTFRTQRTRVDGMHRIAFQLDGTAIHNTRRDAASAGAHQAHGWDNRFCRAGGDKVTDWIIRCCVEVIQQTPYPA